MSEIFKKQMEEQFGKEHVAKSEKVVESLLEYKKKFLAALEPLIIEIEGVDSGDFILNQIFKGLSIQIVATKIEALEKMKASPDRIAEFIGHEIQDYVSQLSIVTGGSCGVVEFSKVKVEEGNDETH